MFLLNVSDNISLIDTKLNSYKQLDVKDSSSNRQANIGERVLSLIALVAQRLLTSGASSRWKRKQTAIN